MFGFPALYTCIFAESYAIIRTNIRERRFEKGRKMVIQENLGILDKLKILSDAAKYDVACTSSGTNERAAAQESGIVWKPVSVTAFRRMADVFLF